MKYILFVVGLVIGFTLTECANANEGLYIEGGLSVHLTKYDTPEGYLDNPIANFGVGYTYKYKDDINIDTYLEHSSSLLTTEEGYGLNQVGVKLRIYLK